MDGVTHGTLTPAPRAVSDRLDSWKEIAAHLGRTVRTVQRWERTCGLPVHRHRHSEGSSVYAFRSALDAWWISRSSRLPETEPDHGPAADLSGTPTIAVPESSEKSAALLDGPILLGGAPRYCVGRQCEQAQLRAALARVRTASGLLVAVAGEPGIGKTTLVEDFLAGALDCHTGRSRSAERLGGTETYLPLLDALDDLIRRDASGSLRERLRTWAPLWYAQLAPGVAPDAAGEGAGQASVAQQRIKRELLAFLQQASREQPVVLFLDDLHWADPSTLDLLAYVASHFDGLQVLIVVSYRPEELVLHQQPFVTVKHDLTARGVCRTVEPRLLTRADIDAYLSLRLAGHDLPATFADALFARTEGNPLFTVALVTDICDSGGIQQVDGVWRLMRPLDDIAGELPASVLGMVQRKIDRLPDAERRVLLAASVQGLEFAAAIVGDVVQMDAAETEERLQRLQSVHGFLNERGEVELPDGRLTLRYQFVHALYHERLRASLTPARLAVLSRTTAEALQRTYGESGHEIASRLAVLYEAARDFQRAADCFLTATRRAVRVFAYEDAVMLGRRGLDAVAQLRDEERRRQCELEILLAIAFPLKTIRGFASDELPQLYERARHLCAANGQTRELADVVWGQWSSQGARLELDAAEQSVQLLQDLALGDVEPRVAVQASIATGVTAYYRGDYRAACDGCRDALRRYDPRVHGPLRVTAGWDPAMSAQGHMAWASLALGYPDRAVLEAQAGVQRAREVEHVHTLVYALCIAVFIHQWRGDQVRFSQSLTEMRRLAGEYQLLHFSTIATFLDGQTLAQQGHVREGLEQMREGLRIYVGLGARTSHSRFAAALALALGRNGRPHEGLDVVNDALARQGRGRYFEAELLRVQGELLAMGGQTGDLTAAERSFSEALAVARAQQARSFELRVALSACRLRLHGGDAASSVRSLLDAFTEGFDTEDLLAARALLAA